MKLSSAFLNRQTRTSCDHTGNYEATHQGALNILEKGRTTAAWSRVSPAILGDIDHYVHALAGRRT
jgi:hypothetical protein